MACTSSLFDPCEFFLLGYLKNQVFRELVQSISDLKAEPHGATASITEDTLEKEFKNLENRLFVRTSPKESYFDRLIARQTFLSL